MNREASRHPRRNELPDPAGLTVAALREWVRRCETDLPESWLARLRQDRRRGVRQLADQLTTSKQRVAEERTRIEKMLAFERELWESGTTRVAGVDEAGMGPLAGPVVAAAVVLPPDLRIGGIQDSKQLSPQIRSALARSIRESSAAVAVGMATVTEIDRINIYHAGLLTRFPGFGFADHKGYSTSAHRDALARLGPCPEHRRSFPAVAEFAGQMSAPYASLYRAISGARSEQDCEDLRRLVRTQRSHLKPDEYRRLCSLLRRASSRSVEGQPFLPGFGPEVS
ncbi:MAG: hypothetical protein P8Y94_11110 [Acidobacteriota bacterium]